MVGAPAATARAAEEGAVELLGRGRVFVERHEVVGIGAEAPHDRRDAFIDVARQGDVAQHRLAHRHGLSRGDAAVVAGQQHRPFGERHEQRGVDAQLDRHVAAVEAHALDVVGKLRQDLECLRRRHKTAVLKLVGRPTFSTFAGSSAGRKACGSGEHRVTFSGSKRSQMPGIVVGGFGRLRVDRGDALEVGQRRHVHQRQAGDAGVGDAREQGAQLRVRVLRLLHRQHGKIVVGGLGQRRRGGVEAAGKVGRADGAGAPRP